MNFISNFSEKFILRNIARIIAGTSILILLQAFLASSIYIKLKKKNAKLCRELLALESDMSALKKHEKDQLITQQDNQILERRIKVIEEQLKLAIGKNEIPSPIQNTPSLPPPMPPPLPPPAPVIETKIKKSTTKSGNLKPGGSMDDIVNQIKGKQYNLRPVANKTNTKNVKAPGEEKEFLNIKLKRSVSNKKSR